MVLNWLAYQADTRLDGRSAMRLSGKAAIVTGGASGIGEAIARMFVKEGANVLLTDAREAAGQAVAAEIGAAFAVQDVTSEQRWGEIVGEAQRRLGALNVLVNNAGVGDGLEHVSPEDTPLEEWRRINRVNAEGVFLGCKTAIPAMSRAGGGSIINMSSIAALVGTPFLTAYGASKASVKQLTMSVALHCAQRGYRIRCNCVHPGQIRTPMLENLFSEAARQSGAPLEAVEADFKSRIPMGEFGLPDDIAYGVLYLASDESRHVTGASLVIDGGMQIT
jgi:NAD(P)-dependent dehydrogenase (short-subunit alcohol dehydrogenase family)